MADIPRTRRKLRDDFLKMESDDERLLIHGENRFKCTEDDACRFTHAGKMRDKIIKGNFKRQMIPQLVGCANLYRVKYDSSAGDFNPM